MFLRIGIMLICALFLGACQPKPGAPSNPGMVQRDLPAINQEGKLRALVAYSATSYFLYRGQPMGYEYELLERLAEELGLVLEIKVASDLDDMLEELNTGQVDLVAHGLAVTSERKNKVAFTDYLYLTKQVLVQKKPKNWRELTYEEIGNSLVQDPVHLIGDTVSVRRNSSYLERLEHLSREIGGEIVIDTLTGNLSTDEIIRMVEDEKIKYTVADRNLARINASYFPSLDVSVPVSFSQRIAWAVRPGSLALLGAVNSWLDKEKKGPDYYVIYNKYFKNQTTFRKRAQSDYYSLNKSGISEFDHLIKRYATSLGWDWRLLASLVYQESKFDPDAESWTGARGLMQMLPSTAEELGVENLEDPEAVLAGGTRYLKQIYNQFGQVPDSIQRVKLTIASYNCGYEHVRDAQSLALLRGLDAHCWDNNVDQMILALSYPKNYNLEVVSHGYVRGMEPFNYVNQIFDRFAQYASIIN